MVLNRNVGVKIGIFSPRDCGQLLTLVKKHPLAWIIVAHDSGFATSMMLLLLELAEDGQINASFGHLPRAHPQVDMLRAKPRALILFHGPEAYISPGMVAKPQCTPTWNFTVAAFTVDIEFTPDETDRALRDLVTVIEETRSGRDHRTASRPPSVRPGASPAPRIAAALSR